MNSLLHPVVFQTEPSPSNKKQVLQVAKLKLDAKRASPKPLISFSPASFSVGNSFIASNQDEKPPKTAVIILNKRTKTPNPNSSRSKKTAPATPSNELKAPKVALKLTIENLKKLHSPKEQVIEGALSTRDFTSTVAKMTRQKSAADLGAVVKDNKDNKDNVEKKEAVMPKERTPEKKKGISPEKRRPKALAMEKISMVIPQIKPKDILTTMSSRKSSTKRSGNASAMKDKRPTSKSKSKGRAKNNGISTYCFESQTDLERINTEPKLEMMKPKTTNKKRGKVGLELDKLRMEKIQDQSLIQKLQEEVISLKHLLKVQIPTSTTGTVGTPTHEGSISTSPDMPPLNHHIKSYHMGPVDANMNQKEVDMLKAQNETLRITIDFLKSENNLLKDAKKQALLYKEAAKKYKELAESRTKDYYGQNEDGINTLGMTPKSSILRLYYTDSPVANQRNDEWPSKFGTTQKSEESIASGTDYKILEALDGQK